MNKKSLFDKKSRYVLGGTSEREELGIGWWERKIFQPAADDELIVVSGRHVHRIDLLAHDFLGDSKLWWIIAQYNSIIDPHEEIIEGKYLRIPSKNVISLLTGTVGGSTSQRTETSKIILPIV